MFQQASQREGGLQASFDNNDFTPSSDSVYVGPQYQSAVEFLTSGVEHVSAAHRTIYLFCARPAAYVRGGEVVQEAAIPQVSKYTIHQIVVAYASPGDIAVHLLTAALLLLAILAVTSHIIHRRDRRQLRLRHQVRNDLRPLRQRPSF